MARAKPSIAEEEEEYRWHVLTRLRDAGVLDELYEEYAVCRLAHLRQRIQVLEERSTCKTSQRERIRARGGLERGAEVAFPPPFPPFPLPISCMPAFHTRFH